MDAPPRWAVNWLRYGCAIAAVAAAATFGAPTAALAQDYPTRPIRLVVVTAAGGLMDVAARVTAEHVGKALGQSIVIENRPGGGGNLGAEAIAKAAPDGYTIGLIQLGNVAINPHIYADMTFDPLNDLAPVAPVTSSAGTPTGTVTFKDGAAALGTATLAAGVATLTTSSLTLGSHTITASYVLWPPNDRTRSGSCVSCDELTG